MGIVHCLLNGMIILIGVIHTQLTFVLYNVLGGKMEEMFNSVQWSNKLLFLLVTILSSTLACYFFPALPAQLAELVLDVDLSDGINITRVQVLVFVSVSLIAIIPFYVRARRAESRERVRAMREQGRKRAAEAEMVAKRNAQLRKDGDEKARKFARGEFGEHFNVVVVVSLWFDAKAAELTPSDGERMSPVSDSDLSVSMRSLIDVFEVKWNALARRKLSASHKRTLSLLARGKLKDGSDETLGCVCVCWDSEMCAGWWVSDECVVMVCG